MNTQTSLNGLELVVVRVLTRDTITDLKLIATLAECEIDTLPPEMRPRARLMVAFLRTLRLSDVIVRQEDRP